MSSYKTMYTVYTVDSQYRMEAQDIELPVYINKDALLLTLRMHRLVRPDQVVLKAISEERCLVF